MEMNNPIWKVQAVAQENKLAVVFAAIFLLSVIVIIELIILKLNKKEKEFITLDPSLSHLAQEHKDIFQ